MEISMKHSDYSLQHWSGSLLCAVGLYLAQKEANIACLINLRGISQPTKIIEKIPVSIHRALADSLKVPLFSPNSSINQLKKDIEPLLTLVNQKYGVHSVILNAFEQDLVMKELKKNYGSFSLKVQNYIQRYHPDDLFKEAIHLGFKAKILSVNEKYLGSSSIGSDITLDMLEVFKTKNIHPFGLNGEFETVCIDGPNFTHNIPLVFGDMHFKHNLWFREVSIEQN